MRLPAVHREPARVAEMTDTKTFSITRPAVNSGSVSGKFIGEDRLARLDKYRTLAEQLMSSHRIDVKGKNRTVANVEDVATLAVYQHIALDDELEAKYQQAMKDVDL